MQAKTRRWLLLLLALLIASLSFMAVLLRQYPRLWMSRGEQAAVCVGYLKEIDDAKVQGIMAGLIDPVRDFPIDRYDLWTWGHDGQPPPVCPSGGTYLANPFEENPVCTVHGDLLGPLELHRPLPLVTRLLAAGAICDSAYGGQDACSTLHLRGPDLADLSALRGQPVRHLQLPYGQAVVNEEILRGLSSLATINGQSVSAFWAMLDKHTGRVAIAPDLPKVDGSTSAEPLLRLLIARKVGVACGWTGLCEKQEDGEQRFSVLPAINENDLRSDDVTCSPKAQAVQDGTRTMGTHEAYLNLITHQAVRWCGTHIHHNP